MIEVQDVTYRYPGQSEAALSHITVEVRPAEIVGIVGPNGSGKSTLGRMMKGLIRPTDGRIRVDSLDTEEDSLDVRRLVGLVFQNPNSQIVNSVVEQEVAFGPENIGLPSTEIRARVGEALQAVGLQGRETDECHSLSMADKQRVALAAVIAMHPRYLILDEPTAWLEPASRWPLLDEIVRWSTDRGAALVLITHRMDEAQLCSRLYGMLNGRIETVGTPEDVLGCEETRSRLALEVPEVLELAHQLEAAGVPVGAAAGIERLAEELCQS